MTDSEVLATIKQAANTLYALGWNQIDPLTSEDRGRFRQLSEKLDEVTKAMGGNPLTPAWHIPGNPRRAEGARDGLSESAVTDAAPQPATDHIVAESPCP